jgi:hypothetical protein
LELLTFVSRPDVQTSRDLFNILPIYYYDLVDGVPVFSSPRKLGFTYSEILSGADDWFSDELSEFAGMCSIGKSSKFIACFLVEINKILTKLIASTTIQINRYINRYKFI